MQYLCNQWSDFNNSWSCLILTLLWIQRYTVYPPHLNYTTTLPRKTITIKITIFHGNFFGNTRIVMTNSPDLNPLDYIVWGATLECYKTFQPKPNTTHELMSWRKSCKQNSINKAVLSIIKTSSLCESWGDTLNTSSNKLFLQGFELLASCDSLKCQISMFRLISI